MTDRNTVIVCKNLWKIFGPDPERILNNGVSNDTKEQILEKTGHVVAVKDVSFEVCENEIFVVMGLSGSGKSTLVRCLNRLIEPTRGQIMIDGIDLGSMNANELKELRRNKLSMVFQHFGLLPHRSVLDNVALGLEIKGESKKERREKTLRSIEVVGLKGWEKSRIFELSGGMQQRVGLARALANDPEILLMDEPFSALAPLIRRQMQDEFLNLRSKMMKTVIFITHDFLEALKLGDRIAIMKDGEVVQLGTPEEIVANPANDYVSEFVKDVPRGKVILAQSIMEEPSVVISSDQNIEDAVNKMAAKKAVTAFVVDASGKQQMEGILTMEQAISAARKGKVTAGEIAQTEYPSTTIESPLEDNLHLFADGNIPIAVLDEKKHLKGMITRKAIIQAMQVSNGNSGKD